MWFLLITVIKKPSSVFHISSLVNNFINSQSSIVAVYLHYIFSEAILVTVSGTHIGTCAMELTILLWFQL